MEISRADGQKDGRTLLNFIVHVHFSMFKTDKGFAFQRPNVRMISTSPRSHTVLIWYTCSYAFVDINCFERTRRRSFSRNSR